MNRSRIEWCDYTWNPVTGCRHGCRYCYARRMTARFAGDIRLNKMAKSDYAMVPAADGGESLYVLDSPMVNETGRALVYPFGFEPTFHRYRMGYPEKLKMGASIFVGAMSDMFGEWVPEGWIDEIMEACTRNPIHNYLFLTKYPQRYGQHGVPKRDNMWYGTTVTTENEVGRAMCLPAGCRRFVSIEPILEDISPDINYPMFRCIDWIIIGAETGHRKDKTAAQWEWVRKIALEADRNGIPVFMKDSLISVVGEKNMRREFPESIMQKSISPKMKKKLFGICGKCDTNMKKSDMITLLARSRRGEQPKQFGFMCKDCFIKMCKEFNVEIPDLSELKDIISRME